MKLKFTAFMLLAASLLHSAENEAWKRPFPPYRIVGNIYYVGTEDLACYLIKTRQGNILINTGLADSLPLLHASIQKLGFNMRDIRVLLTMQAHYDHVAAMAAVQKETRAKFYATVPDVPALESGGKLDPPDFDNSFAPIHIDRKLKDGDLIRLGDAELTVHLHPGHTKGSASYSMIVDDGGTKKSLLFLNMLSVVMKLDGNTVYPNIKEDFEKSFAAQKQLHPDIWVAAHGAQYSMMERQKAGKPYAEAADYLPAIERSEKQYRETLAKQPHP
jgi:Metallo-beta-lactamase superfamily